MLLMVMMAGTMNISRQPNMAPLMLTTKPTSLSTRASRVTTESTPTVIGPAAASRSRPDSWTYKSTIDEVLRVYEDRAGKGERKLNLSEV